MSRAGWLLLVFVVVAGGAIAAVPRPPAEAVVHAAAALLPADDPFPIRRVRGSDARLSDLLKELEPGPVVRLPRPEFEARVRAAGRAVLRTKQAPRVVDAAYTAEFDNGDLTGTAQLGILNPHGVTGFVPLDPLRLAVRGVKWSDGPAVLAVPPGATTPAVWVDRDGRRVLQLNWSLAGITEPGERRFELRVPVCPTSSLELSLPAEQIPTVSTDVLLTGPFAAPGQPGRRLWRLRFGGRSKVEFALRTAGAAGVVAQAKLSARYDLAPGQLTAAFEYELHPVRGSAGEWAFTADPGLRITDVVTNNRAGWTVDPPATPGGSRRVRVSLRQPGPGGKVLLTAVAPFPDPARPDSPLPAVRPLNAVLNDEKLELRVAPGLKVESWNPGDYRLTEATSAATGLLPGAADQPRVLSLVGSLATGVDEASRRMPTVRTAHIDADFTTYERLTWELDAKGTVLIARVGVRVRRGPLFQVSVRPPPGFTLDRGVSIADELVSNVGPFVNGQHAVEFARPLASGQYGEFRLEFHGPGAKFGVPAPFPAFAVSSAAERDGWLSVSAPPTWAAIVRAGAGASPAGLWGWLTADAPASARAVYFFRGNEPDGTATFLPARQKVTADALVRLDAAAGRWIATTRFTLAVTGGVLPSVAIFVPGPPGERSWKLLDTTNTITEAAVVPQGVLESLPLLAPLGTHASFVTARARRELNGTLWVVRFARPLAGAAVIETTAAGPPVSDTTATLPIPRLVGAKQTTHAGPAAGVADRTEVTLAGNFIRPGSRPAPAPGLAASAVSDAYLVTAIRSPGDALAAFGGTVRDTRGGVLRVSLPPGADVRGVCVAGRWLNPAACSERDSDGTLHIPISAGPTVRFEVRYRLPVDSGWPTRRVESQVPGMPGGAPPVRRWWAFGPGTLPGWPARPWDTTADAPPLLGGPLGGEPLVVVTRSDDEWVRVGAARTADAFAVGVAAGLVVLALLALRHRRARGATLLAAFVAINLLTVELGPPWWARAAWPPLLAGTIALGGVLIGIAFRGRSLTPAAVAAGLFLSLMYSLTATAQPTAPVTVLIVPGANGGEEVIAPRSILNRLDAIAHPPLPAAVVTAAEYALHTDSSGARITAKFVVHAFRSGESAVSIPLTDARLERATVDGSPAFPTSPQPNVYTLAVSGPGRHEIELRFAASITTTGPEREVRFGVPEVPEVKLTATLPGAARQPQAVGRMGRQVVATSGNNVTLAADLGGTKSVHLRWREGAAGAAVVKVREGCVWDLAEAGADLTAAYLVRVEQGTIGGMRFEIPAELEVLRVVARITDTPAGAVPLRDWSLGAEKAGGRLLRIDFQTPATGRLLLVLECSPRKPLTRQPVLRFPRINFGGVTGETEAVYGLRASKLTIDGVGLGGVIDFPADALKDFTTVPDLKLDPANPVRAFRPATPGAAELRPVLHIGEPAIVRTATAWHAGPHRADATGTVSWQAKEPLPLVEFTLGGVKVLDVRGPDVTSWSQSGGRVQIWLRTGVREGAIEWTGTISLAPTNKPPPNSLPFDPAHPLVMHARTAADDLRVKAADGWTVRPDRSRGWQSVPAPPGEVHFHTDLPAAPALRVQLARAK